jgi:hypothetical protein
MPMERSKKSMGLLTQPEKIKDSGTKKEPERLSNLGYFSSDMRPPTTGGSPCWSRRQTGNLDRFDLA